MMYLWGCKECGTVIWAEQQPMYEHLIPEIKTVNVGDRYAVTGVRKDINFCLGEFYRLASNGKEVTEDCEWLEGKEEMSDFLDQPIHFDDSGVVRFKDNKIVRYLLDAGPFDLNDLAKMNFSNNDRMQFAQLIGYSVSGFGSLSYVSDEVCERNDERVEDLIRKSNADDTCN